MTVTLSISSVQSLCAPIFLFNAVRFFHNFRLSDKKLRAANGYAFFHREDINKQEMASVDISEHSPLLLKDKKPTSKAETKEDKEDELPASLSKVSHSLSSLTHFI